MNSEIENIQLAFNCPANWDNMSTTDGGRHCDSCNKTVYDFTDAKPREFLQIMAEQGNDVCGRFKSAQLLTEPIRLPVWKKWASAALVLIGINIFNHKSYAQAIPLPPKPSAAEKLTEKGANTIKINDRQATDDKIFNGFVVVPTAEFPGGEAAFTKFLSTHIKYTRGIPPEKVIAAFQIKKDGSVGDIKIMRGKNPANIAEVVRVLKLSPKWKPSKLNGKSVETEFTVPISFGDDPKPAQSSSHPRG